MNAALLKFGLLAGIYLTFAHFCVFTCSKGRLAVFYGTYQHNRALRLGKSEVFRVAGNASGN